MEAVVVTYNFAAPTQPSDRAVEDHQAMLEELPGLRSSLALRRGTEWVFVLAFDRPADIEAYFERPEVRDFGRQPGCFDVYANRLNVLGLGGEQRTSHTRINGAVAHMASS